MKLLLLKMGRLDDGAPTPGKDELKERRKERGDRSAYFLQNPRDESDSAAAARILSATARQSFTAKPCVLELLKDCLEKSYH